MALNPWKVLCCSAQHYQVHQIIKGRNSGVYTKDEAKNKLKNIDIDISDFKPNIKQIVEDILKEDKHLIEPIVEVSEEVVVEKPVYSRKRKYKTNYEIKEVDEVDAE
jgi:tetrahydromethanopterin S-methyltransferase subunit H